MSVTNKTIFISYAREDVGAARRIAEALRSFDLEVWFDQNELRGGEAWDAKLRIQIREDTIKQLQNGVRVRDPGLMFIGFDRRFDPLRQDARFKQIMKTIGLTN